MAIVPPSQYDPGMIVKIIIKFCTVLVTTILVQYGPDSVGVFRKIAELGTKNCSVILRNKAITQKLPD